MYIGNTVQNQGFVPAIDYFSGNASTTSFTLSRPVASVAQILVHVANVTQNPSTAYSVSGNTITFTSAPPIGTNNIWIEYTSLITQTIAPSPGTVGAAQLPQSQILTSVQMPTGSVIQVVNGTISSQISTTSNGTYVTTGLTATITPQFTTSKIFALVSSTAYASVNAAQPQVTLYRNGSNIGNSSGFSNLYITGGTTVAITPINFNYLDSPASTSTLTYTVYFQNANNTSTVYFGIGGSTNNEISTITLMEIR